MWVRSLGREDPLEKDIATHSSILPDRGAWKATVQGVAKSRKELSTHTAVHTQFPYPACLIWFHGLKERISPAFKLQKESLPPSPEFVDCSAWFNMYSEDDQSTTFEAKMLIFWDFSESKSKRIKKKSQFIRLRLNTHTQLTVEVLVSQYPEDNESWQIFQFICISSK